MINFKVIDYCSVRDSSGNPLCFFIKNIKIAANSPTRSFYEGSRLKQKTLTFLQGF